MKNLGNASAVKKVKLVKRSKPLTSKPIGLKSDVARKKLKETKVDKRAYGSKKKSLRTIADVIADVKRTIKSMRGDTTMKSLIDSSTMDRRQRAKEQLGVFAVRGLRKDVFKFVCRSSGLGVKSSYQVEVMFSSASEMSKELKATPNEIMQKSKVKIQCSCDDFKYRYRYIATKGGFVLGTPQYMPPKITNENLEGSICKHTILVLSKIQKPAFMKVFSRYIENKRKGRTTRIKAKDIISTQSSSGRSKIN